MKKRLFRLLESLIIVFALTVSIFTVFGHETMAEESEDSHYITVTLHAGEHGYFGDPSVKEKESLQFRGEPFNERTVPDLSDDSYIFIGWSNEPDGEVNVTPGVTNTSMIGTDLYAIYTDECLVNYIINDGYVVMDDGNQYQYIHMTYKPGQLFRNLTPVHFDANDFDFAGWYASGLNPESGIQYTEETPVNAEEIDVFARWKLSEERTEYLELDKEYDLSLSGPGRIYAFRPEETDVYKLATIDKVSDDYVIYITVMDENSKVIKMADPVDPEDGWGDMQLNMEMEAGKVYYFQIKEMSGGATDVKIKLTKGECAMVTFHANRDAQSDAWFDDDPSKTVKTIPIAIGEDISKYTRSGWMTEDPLKVVFSGWSLNPDLEWIDDYLIVEHDMDVYAITAEQNVITLDANGGYFRMANNSSVTRDAFGKGRPFASSMDPTHDDNTIKFAGWSRDPDAEVPDPDIIEGVTSSDELDGVTLYAVYGRKVLERWDANGGYFMMNPGITTYESTKGAGHIFYGLTLYHDNERMKKLGWMDHKGEFIPYTADIWPYYHVTEDTTYTAVWGYQVIVDANGGVFALAGSSRLGITMEYEGTFSLSDVTEEIGEAVNYDTSKYLAGWATTPDAEEPDVFEGVTPVRDLDQVYAVWKDDSYYWAEGENGSWTKGSSEGLRFVAKRTGDDTQTDSSFTGASVDQETIYADSFTRESGSLIFTLKPEYLETLAVGRHELTLHFAETDLVTNFTVEEKKEEEKPVEISYTVASGANGSWAKSSGKSYTLTVKRNVDDDTCYSHYKETQIDGKKVTVKAEKGSTVITINSAVLQKLNVGKHKVTIVFNDGKAETELTVTAASGGKKTTPNTGDSNNVPLYTGLLTGALIAAVAAIVLRMKSSKK